MYLATATPVKKTWSVIEICRVISQPAWHWWSCSLGALVHPNYSSGVRSRYFLPLLECGNVYKDSEKSMGRTLQYSLQQRMTGWIYCTNFSANFLQMSSGSSNSNQHLSELNWIAQNHTWNLLMGANFTLILIYIVQLPKRQMSAFSLWFGAYKVSDYCDSLGLRTCQDFLISRIKMFLWYSFLFSENIYNHVY